MGARQLIKWRRGGAQQLTSWKGFHGCTSANQMEARRRTATHESGRDFMGACQLIKWRPGGAQQLTSWKGFHGCTSAIQMEARRRTATHDLEGISWPHVSESNGDQEAHSNSQTGRDFMAVHVRDSNGDQEAHSNSQLEGISWVHVS
jgi:hypothetical protein